MLLVMPHDLCAAYVFLLQIWYYKSIYVLQLSKKILAFLHYGPNFFWHPIFQLSYTLTYARSKSCCINWGKTVRCASSEVSRKVHYGFIEINWLHFSHLTLNCQNKCTNLWRCHVMSVLSSQVSNAMYVQGESCWS